MGRILIVDDHASVANSLKYAVLAAGGEPLVAMSGEAGLAMLRTEKVDLIVLDLHMPGMSGMDVLRLLPSVTSTPPAVVMFTADDSAHVQAEAKSLGVIAFVCKTDLVALIPLLEHYASVKVG